MLRGMWDLPGPGLEPVSPALAGGFLTTAPPGKPHLEGFKHGSNLVNFVLQQNCSGWDVENELEEMGWGQRVPEREGSGLN